MAAHGDTTKATMQREEHGSRGAHRNGPHVWPHETAHKGHGQHGGNHGEGGENGGIADFRDSLDRDVAAGALLVFGETEVAHDVLDDHDGVVDQDADAEDEREERDAIDGVAEEVEDRHGERQRDRNGQQHHARLAPAEEQRDQQA